MTTRSLLASVGTSLLLLGAAPAAQAADITITSLECNTTLPVSASSASLDCYPHDGYCMLGQDVSVKSTVTLSGVYSATAYTMLKISLDIPTTGYSQIDDVANQYALNQYSEPQPINLCTWTSGGYGYCPQDGTYTLRATHTLPTWGDKDWFLTGEKFIAELLIYSDEDGTDLIGDCKAHITTRVTNPTGQNEYYDVPSASRVAMIAGAVIGVAALLICCGCCYMDHRKIELKEADLDHRGGSFEMIQDDPITMSRRRDYDYQ